MLTFPFFFFFDGVKCIDAHTSEKGANTKRSPQLPERGALLPTRNTVPGSPPGRAESVEERVFSRHGSKFREKRVPDSLCTSTVLGSVCHKSCLHRFGMHTRRPVRIGWHNFYHLRSSVFRLAWPSRFKSCAFKPPMQAPYSLLQEGRTLEPT